MLRHCITFLTFVFYFLRSSLCCFLLFASTSCDFSLFRFASCFSLFAFLCCMHCLRFSFSLLCFLHWGIASVACLFWLVLVYGSAFLLMLCFLLPSVLPSLTLVICLLCFLELPRFPSIPTDAAPCRVSASSNNHKDVWVVLLRCPNPASFVPAPSM